MKLACKYADVKEIHIPYKVDGITLDLKVPKKRPKIFLNSSASQNRKRFTTAHELGHILIPWHVGNIIDITSDAPRDGVYDDYWTIETEANNFASELLMPTDWLRGFIKNNDDPEELTKMICSKAGVSSVAATIKLVNTLSAGFVYAQVDRDGTVATSGRTSGTVASSLPWGTSIDDPTKLFASAVRRFDFTIGSSRFFWWNFAHSIPLPRSTRGEDWRTLLNTIVSDAGYDGDRAAALKRSVNGTIAYANGRSQGADRNQEAVYAACLQRFQSNTEMEKIRAHRLFKQFLGARIRALFDGK
ncbi:ImmA/IrrE family metallo-endopeptidase [Vineibacter terrae]|uniref:ImmA/IrrE family metallo-endopeptidase n=1 Tax=Vineibacter terrae TaxID=2586908 RepID=A0A5C8P6S0_9HYPH|nr:ImmA/IrrE family metallo-endopeptidase [Vineibacter terrae]TXL69424.1 ImmA/IrrE family metallo-endopeptidase [Vineibacter terrae]